MIGAMWRARAGPARAAIIVGKPDNPEFTHSMLSACMNLAGRARCIEIAIGAEKRRFRCAKRNPGSTGGSSAQRTVVAHAHGSWAAACKVARSAVYVLSTVFDAVCRQCRETRRHRPCRRAAPLWRHCALDRHALVAIRRAAPHHGAYWLCHLPCVDLTCVQPNHAPVPSDHCDQHRLMLSINCTLSQVGHRRRRYLTRVRATEP